VRIGKERAVDVDHIAALQRTVIRHAVHSNLIDRGTNGLWKGVVVEWRRIGVVRVRPPRRRDVQRVSVAHVCAFNRFAQMLQQSRRQLHHVSQCRRVRARRQPGHWRGV
jgi:hypothetical protein